MLFGGGMPGMPGMGFPGMQMHMGGGNGGPEIRVFHGSHPFGGSMGGNFFQNLQKPPPIMRNVQISLEQSYSGCTIPLEIERWVIYNDIKSSEIETIYITIPAGIDENEYIIMRDHGNKINEQNKGDIKIGVQITNNTDFERHGMDLLYKKTISLKDALCGFSFDIIHLNGKHLCLNNNINRTIIKPNFKKVIGGLGMIRENACGNMIIEFDIEFPDVITDEQVIKLKEVFV